jgi:hypothetical protein
MSFPQQSRSDIAAAEANQRRRELDKRAYVDGSRDAGRGVSPQTGLVGKFRAWLRGLLPR